MNPARLPLHALFNSLRSMFLVSVIGGVYLYVFNTLPALWVPYFRDVDHKTFWHMQIGAISGYTLVALAMFLGTKFLDRWLVPRPLLSLPARIALGTAVIFASMVAMLVGVVLPGFRHLVAVEWGSPWLMCFVSGISGSIVYASILLQRSAVAQRGKRLKMQMDTDNLNTALDRAELSMLEAQIEPHFLFNTLAHVKLQYGIDIVKADRMLISLITYLDRAMPALRRSDWTVSDELDLIKVYLEILEQRFGPRLHFSIAASDAGKKTCIPALIIATLVENSIRHGLAPKPGGGTVSIVVDTPGELLTIEVRDNGMGLQKVSGKGLGLATIHARLRGAFGSRAELLVKPGEPHGVLASIQIPLSRSA